MQRSGGLNTPVHIAGLLLSNIRTYIAVQLDQTDMITIKTDISSPFSCACNHLYVHVTLLLSDLLIHGSVLAGLSRSTLAYHAASLFQG